jgi:hypothetical protein
MGAQGAPGEIRRTGKRRVCGGAWRGAEVGACADRSVGPLSRRGQRREEERGAAKPAALRRPRRTGPGRGSESTPTACPRPPRFLLGGESEKKPATPGRLPALSSQGIILGQDSVANRTRESSKRRGPSNSEVQSPCPCRKRGPRGFRTSGAAAARRRGCACSFRTPAGPHPPPLRSTPPRPAPPCVIARPAKRRTTSWRPRPTRRKSFNQ